MVKVRGVISKAQLRDWLENWQSLEAGDKLPDAIAVNSGAKSRDGITGGHINKIMLDDALGKLPLELQRVVRFRWTGNKVRLRAVLLSLGYGKSEYYRRCDMAVEGIYRIINGLALNYAYLWDTMHKSK